jgi:hypothetical protein
MLVRICLAFLWLSLTGIIGAFLVLNYALNGQELDTQPWHCMQYVAGPGNPGVQQSYGFCAEIRYFGVIETDRDRADAMARAIEFYERGKRYRVTQRGE